MSLLRSETILGNSRYVNTREKQGLAANGVKGTGVLHCLLHYQKAKHPIVAIEFHLRKFDGKI